jgi:hypothetical protein
VEIAFTFRNTGTVPISGTAVIQAISSAGEVALAVQQELAEVAPGANVPVQHTWPTAGVAPGAYRVVAYVLYDARATAPLTTQARAGRPVYLPLVRR